MERKSNLLAWITYMTPVRRGREGISAKGLTKATYNRVGWFRHSGECMAAGGGGAGGEGRGAESQKCLLQAAKKWLVD